MKNRIFIGSCADFSLIYIEHWRLAATSLCATSLQPGSLQIQQGMRGRKKKEKKERKERRNSIYPFSLCTFLLSSSIVTRNHNHANEEQRCRRTACTYYRRSMDLFTSQAKQQIKRWNDHNLIFKSPKCNRNRTFKLQSAHATAPLSSSGS